jgi:hypothetical protein
MRPLYHGGAPELRIGDVIEPRTADDTAHLRDDCPVCQARKNGQQLDSDDNDPALVYATTDRQYARIYAAGYPDGGLYRVDPLGDLIDRSDHDAAPSWGCSALRVAAIIDPLVRLSPKRVRALLRRWGQ